MAHPVTALRQGTAQLHGKGITTVIVNQDTHRLATGEREGGSVGEDRDRDQRQKRNEKGALEIRDKKGTFRR